LRLDGLLIALLASAAAARTATALILFAGIYPFGRKNNVWSPILARRHCKPQTASQLDLLKDDASPCYRSVEFT
jgi:hypothetical protein